MSVTVTLVAVLGILGFSMGVPVEESVPYNPQDLYPPSYTLDGPNAPEEPTVDLDKLPYNPQDFYPPSYTLNGPNAPEEPTVDLDKLPYNTQDIYPPSYTLNGPNAPEEPTVDLDKLPYNPQDFYPPSYTLDGPNAPEEPTVDLDKLPYNPQDFYSSPLLESLPESSGSRIVGGTEAKDGSAPYMVSLFMGDLVPSFLCGGSLVTPCSVLTAAHCIDPMVSWIDGQLMHSAHGRIGSNSLSKDYSVVRFAGYENHPAWDPWLIKNDIGVLRLAKKVEWSKRVQPLKISYDFVGGGQLVRVTGWGRLSDDVHVVNPDETESNSTAWGDMPDRLQELSVHVLSPKECEEGIREANAMRSSPPVYPEIELCTLHKRGAGYGMCNGDSGSALTLKGRQVAIVSWGWPCARGRPDVSARTSGFVDWLPRVLRKCKCSNI